MTSKLPRPDPERPDPEPAGAESGDRGPSAGEGELWNGFRLLGTLGRGNTSRVFVAQRLRPKEGGPKEGGLWESGAGAGHEAPTVALKRPLPETLADKAAAERFANEVRLSLQFRHPHLVGGLEGTPFGPHAFLTMPLYPGGPLDVRLQAGRLPTSQSLRVLADVAAGLHELHRHGAVHQDVKTQNVYLASARSDRAALGDFGSTFFEAQGGRPSGSPFFMAPEIYQGEVGTAASDVYSFGVLAYEMLSGVRPHLGDTYEQLMVSHLTRFPAPLSRPELPRRLTKLLELTLAKRAAARPVARALQRELLASIGEPLPPDPSEHEPEPAERPTLKSAGRHGPAALRPLPTPAPAPAAKPDPKPGWNPFRRRK